MAGMPLSLTYNDLATRLLLAFIAGALLGLNRSEKGKAAGMRTTILVCLAAATAMLQVNLLLPMAGKPQGSFITNDLMRFPLGILTGVGFIGGGAILRHGNKIDGVTTAATIWLATVIGLAFGGGQLLLGSIVTAVGLGVLWGLKWVEDATRREHRAQLSIEIRQGGPPDAALRKSIIEAGLKIIREEVTLNFSDAGRLLVLDVVELRRPSSVRIPAIVYEISHQAGTGSIHWRPQ